VKIEIRFTPETDDERTRFTSTSVELTAASVFAGPRRTSPSLFLLEADLRGGLPNWSRQGVTAISYEDDQLAGALWQYVEGVAEPFDKDREADARTFLRAMRLTTAPVGRS